MIPLNPLTFTLKAAGYLPLNKLREHFHLTNSDLKAYATNPRNLTLAALTVGGATAVLMNPVTRVALCTFLSMSATLSTIGLNLLLFGLYLAWMTAKSVGSAATVGTSIASTLFSVFKDLFGTESSSTTNKPEQEIRGLENPAVQPPKMLQGIKEVVEEFEAFQREEDKPEQEVRNLANPAVQSLEIEKMAEEFETLKQSDSSITTNLTRAQQRVEQLNIQSGKSIEEDLVNEFKTFQQNSSITANLTKAQQRVETEENLVDEFESFKKEEVLASKEKVVDSKLSEVQEKNIRRRLRMLQNHLVKPSTSSYAATSSNSIKGIRTK